MTGAVWLQGLFCLFYISVMLIKPLRFLYKYTSPFFIVALVITAVALSLSLKEKSPLPTPDFFFAPNEKAAKNHILNANVYIEKKLSRDRYYAKIEPLSIDQKNIFYVKESVELQPQEEYFGSVWERRKREWQQNRKQFQHSYSKSHRQENIIKVKEFVNEPHPHIHLTIKKSLKEKSEISFPEIYEGCVLKVKLSGYGVPHYLKNDSFGNYLNKNGMVGELRIFRPESIESRTCDKQTLRSRFREALYRQIETSNMGELEMAIAEGFILGKTSSLDREFKNRVRELGVIHIFAASGLHLAIFYFVLHAPLRLWFGRKHPLALLLPLPIAFFYTWLLAFPVSLTRALVFVTIYGIQSLFHRRMETRDTLLNTALILLSIMPRESISLSAALSMGAVTGIFYFQKPIRKLMTTKSKVTGFIADNASVTLSASVFTTPILMITFHGYSFGSIVANVILVPYTSLLLVLLFVGTPLDTILYFLFQNGANMFHQMFWWIMSQGMTVFISGTGLLSQVSFYKTYETPFALPLFVSILLILCLIVTQSLKSKKIKIILQRVVVVLILMLSPAGYFLDKLLPSLHSNKKEMPAKAVLINVKTSLNSYAIYIRHTVRHSFPVTKI